MYRGKRAMNWIPVISRIYENYSQRVGACTFFALSRWPARSRKRAQECERKQARKSESAERERKKCKFALIFSLCHTTLKIRPKATEKEQKKGSWARLMLNKVQSLVSCGGGQRPADGLRQQHVRTIRLLEWDTLEDFTAILTYTWDKTKDDSACCTYVRGRFSEKWRTSIKTSGFPSKDWYSNNVGLNGDSRGGGDGQEDKVATLEVHQRGRRCLAIFQLKQQTCRGKM